MDIRQSISSLDAKTYDTDRIRDEFLITDIFIPDKVKRVYSHIDRIITMGYCPANQELDLEQDFNTMNDLGTDYFLERRELGVINIGGSGKINVDGNIYKMSSLDGIYIGMGAKKIVFSSEDNKNPAKYYSLSAPAHATHPTVHVDITKAKKVQMGSDGASNKRVINQYIHSDVMKTCQLMMGLTELAPNNVWNTMPAHTHDRRMEVYFYFGVDDDNAVFHYMGEPNQTRHIVVRNEQAIISPSWSIHSGCGTGPYKFIWGMVGENQTFSDMDHIAIKDLK